MVAENTMDNRRSEQTVLPWALGLQAVSACVGRPISHPPNAIVQPHEIAQQKTWGKGHSQHLLIEFKTIAKFYCINQEVLDVRFAVRQNIPHWTYNTPKEHGTDLLSAFLLAKDAFYWFSIQKTNQL